MKKNTLCSYFTAFIVLLVFININAVAQQKSANFKSQLDLANKVKDIKNNDSAANYAKELIKRAQSLNDKTWESQILLAQAYRSYSMGDVRMAKGYGEQSSALAQISDSTTYVKSNLMVSYMLNRQGRDTEALKIAFEIMRKAESLRWGTLLVESKICIADIYRTVNESEKGLVYAKQAYNDAKSLKDTATYIFAISTLSNLYSNKGISTPENLVKATDLYKIIINEPYFSTLSSFSKARHLSNMARLYEMQDQLELSEQVLLKSIAISRKEGYKNIEAHALNELMTVKIGQADYHDALKHGYRAADLLNGESGFNLLQRNIYRNISTAYVKLKRFEKALDYSNQARIITDSLVANDKIEVAKRLDEEYKADKRIIEATANTKLMKQQRNFSIAIAIIIVVALIAIYRWVLYRRQKQADLLAEKHLQETKLNNLKTTFFTNISHELRTPLTLISGPIEQLKNDEATLSSTQKKAYVDSIWLNSKKLLNLLNELLELGKLEAGSIVINKQPTDINKFAKRIFQGFSSAAEYKKIDYSLSLHIEEGINLEMDREKIEKILTNLINNALKFTPSNGRINVQLNLNNEKLAIDVNDSGKGISEEELPNIFERYYQVVQDQNQAEGGTGIGLAITKEITELLGGTLNVKSELGKGSLFSVSIPIKIAETKRPIIDQQTASATLLQVDNPTDLILVVEDQNEMADYISSILNQHYKLIFASNGIEALGILNNLSEMPSLIISDIMMPEMDGLSLLKSIKEHPTFCRIPMVMLTAVTDEASKYTALSIGVDDYLTKPFNSKELFVRVSNLIQNLKERFNFTQSDKAEPSINVPSNEVSPADLIWLKELEALVIKNTGKKNLDVSTISYDMAVSERQLFRNIKRITGLTPNKYIRTVRLQVAREAIESGKYKTISEIAYVAGFETPAYFSKLFKEQYGRDVNDFIQ
ncbi:MAG: response regulator [Pedobacter sp.]|nr:MAG: response regulator [Pedobacter sp.]